MYVMRLCQSIVDFYTVLKANSTTFGCVVIKLHWLIDCLSREFMFLFHCYSLLLILKKAFHVYSSQLWNVLSLCGEDQGNG